MNVNVSDQTVENEVDVVACAVCPHPMDFHDRIAARFCVATDAGQFSRGCVCTPAPDKESR